MSLSPGRVDHIPALRIALGLALPLALLLLVNRVDWAMYAGFGAFTGIYSRYESTRSRVRRQSMVAVLLTACVTIGASLASLGSALPGVPSSLLTLVVSSAVAGAAAVFITVQGLKPGGAVFPLFAVAAVAAAPPAASIPVAAGIAAASAAWCVLLGLAFHWLGERHAAAGVGVARETFTLGQMGAEFGRYSVASACAGLLGLASGLPFPYWAQIAAVVPLSAPGRAAQVERGVHRVVGSSLGIVTTAFLLSFPSEPWQLVVWVVVMQFVAELYVLRNYALALMFITPLALLMVQMAHPQEAGPMLQARVVETTIGVAVGIVMVNLSAAWDRARAVRWAAARRHAQARRAHGQWMAAARRASAQQTPVLRGVEGEPHRGRAHGSAGDTGRSE